MISRTPLAKAIRLAIGGAVGLTVSMTAPSAMAQDLQETIYVTGSRIGHGSDFESPSPVVTVDREAIEKSGYTNLQQLLVKLPAAGNGTFSTRGNNQDSTANGAAGISLRGLGADATLVLVNGRRVAISSFAENITTGFVDINSIPVSAIERVEVLKDGASAVYGSDAVAGVINIVLRKDFEGLEFSTGYGQTTSSGLDEVTASAVWGTGSDAGNVTVIFEYFKNSTLFNAERGPLGSADQSARGGLDQRSSRSFPGRFVVDGTTMIDPACPPERTFGETCVFDYGPFNMLTPEAERSGLLLLGRQDIGSGVEIFTEVAVQHNTSMAMGAPTPLDETALLTVPATHPDNIYPGATTIDIGRFRTVDAGPRIWDIETDNLRMVLGLRGGFNDWDWEVSGQRGRSESTQTGSRSQGWVRTDFLQQQIDLGNYNPYGGTINDPDVINNITTSLVRQGKSDLTAFDATLTGALWDMASGPVRMAAGLEYREEKISDVPDDQFQRGLIFGTESISASAKRDITSAFVEFAVPLLDTVELQVAGRDDDYSDFGNTTNPKVALRWEVTDTFALRGSWSEGFRAPSLSQIGLGPSQESEFFQDTFGCADNPVYCTNTDFLIVFAGNPDLEAEESESFNLGAIWQPTDALSLSLDFWDITQDNKIDEVPRIFIYNANCNDQASTICVRGAPLPGDTLGPLQQLNSGFVNISSQSAQGVDLSLLYGGLQVGGADVSIAFDYSRLLELERVELDGTGLAFITRDLTGEYEYPEDRATLRTDWVIGDFSVNAALNYVGSFEDFGADESLKQRSVSAFTTLNLQFSYSGIRNTLLTLGIDNALDESVPFAIGDSDTDLYGFVASQHDPRGRFVYGKATFNFGR
jgi:outer membrane receptor for ferrienterochelin and colicin